MVKTLIALFSCLVILSIGGCKSKGTIQWEQKLERQNQERKLALARHEERIDKLPSCEGAQWFDYCTPDFYLPDYRSVQVHIVLIGKEGQSYVRRVAKQALEDRGYNVWIGDDITEREYFAIDVNFDDDYLPPLPSTPIAGVQSCKIINPQYGKGSNPPEYYEVIYNKPLIDKLLLSNQNGKNVDAVLLVKIIFSQNGMIQGWRVDSQIIDVKAKKLTLWNPTCYRSSVGDGMKAMMTTKTGSQYSKVVGNEVYTSTPYWFEGNKRALLSEAMEKMFDHLPRRVGDKVELRTISKECKESSPKHAKIIMVFN